MGGVEKEKRGKEGREGKGKEGMRGDVGHPRFSDGLTDPHFYNGSVAPEYLMNS